MEKEEERGKKLSLLHPQKKENELIVALTSII